MKKKEKKNDSLTLSLMVLPPLQVKIKEKLFSQSQEDAYNSEGQGSAPEERERLRNGPWDLWTECDKYLEMKHIAF